MATMYGGKKERVMNHVGFEAGSAPLNRAWRLAMGDLSGNIVPYQDGLLKRKEPVFLAGMDYDTPWTRDAAINTFFGGGLLFPDAARNTLLSVLERHAGSVRIGGQYWDAVIWAWGAWQFWLYTGDRNFLELAFEAVANSLVRFEVEEFDSELGLFRGAACYADGISAYPDVFGCACGSGGILDWPKQNRALAAAKGWGLPMHALSTNCLYRHAYVLAGKMALALGLKSDPAWGAKADALKSAINRHFWMPEAGRYRYLVDQFGGSEHQEGLGHSFAILLGVAETDQTVRIMREMHVTPQGVPCLWPPFERYRQNGPEHYGRQSGTVWPHVQGFWALAVRQSGRADLFEAEYRKLADLAVGGQEFREIYHPDTGLPYGGQQEYHWQAGQLTPSCRRQTWSATAYLGMTIMGVFGMEFESGGIRFRPTPLHPARTVVLERIPYRGMELSIRISGNGPRVTTFEVNGRLQDEPFLSADHAGEQRIEISMGGA